ncbi:YihY/virulence factor BrkB family protein [Salinibacter grassmerensis]|uniref:YihY/virulence factor BrkB family protein n=1 Tax=Salinibacter grassmerensis TaxID=3040353 RepID=UPI0021E80D18|nr:YihY/virulence factor BrkB family protein [Salinibacter grassmerensis]
MSLADAKQLVLDTLSAYSDDHGERLAAAVAYYATFSLAPLLVLALSVAGLLYGQRSEAAQTELKALVQDVVGPEGAALMETILEGAAAAPDTGLWATALSSLALVVGATALFARLQDALNTIWGATPRFTGVVGFLWSRGLSLLLVVGAGLTVVASLLVSTLLVGLADQLGVQGLLLGMERLGALVILTLLFAVLYRTLPDAPVRWADVWLGAAGAAALMTVGTWGLGWYLGRASVTSSYGAAGALVALLLWVYYSAQIFFLGAELTTVYARRTAHLAFSSEETVSPVESSSSPRSEQSRSSSWPARLGWVALGVVLAHFFRR